MEYAETHPQHFFGFEQVAYIGSGVSSAGRAVTAFFYRALVQFELSVKKIDLSMVGIQMSMASVSGRVNTVKEVYAPFHTFQNIGRSSHTHQIGRFVCGQIRYRFIQDMVHLFMGLTHRQTAYGIAVQIQLPDSFGVLNTDIRIYGALVNTEKHLFLLIVSSRLFRRLISALQRSSHRVVRATEFST